MVDFQNEASSGAGWTTGKDGLPKLPINSVLIVLGVGGVILEAASHAPVFSVFMPRVLQVRGAAGGRAVRVVRPWLWSRTRERPVLLLGLAAGGGLVRCGGVRDRVPQPGEEVCLKLEVKSACGGGRHGGLPLRHNNL